MNPLDTLTKKKMMIWKNNNWIYKQLQIVKQLLNRDSLLVKVEHNSQRATAPSIISIIIPE